MVTRRTKGQGGGDGHGHASLRARKPNGNHDDTTTPYKTSEKIKKLENWLVTAHWVAVCACVRRATGDDCIARGHSKWADRVSATDVIVVICEKLTQTLKSSSVWAAICMYDVMFCGVAKKVNGKV